MANRSSRPACPSEPVDLVAVVVGGRQVLLAWTECGTGSGGLGFCVERATCDKPGERFVEIGKVGPHVAAFRDGDVDPGITYRYRVLARNVSGDSPPSNLVEVTTPLVDTEPPSDKD
jgi:hypothetical protein